MPKSHLKSLRLQSAYSDKQALLNFTLSPTIEQTLLQTIVVPNRTQKHSYWCANYDTTTDSFTIGRIVKNAPSAIYIQHWIVDPLPQSDPKVKSPSSQLLRIKECAGCHLHDTTACQTFNKGIDNRLASHPCLFKGIHSSFAVLKHVQQHKYERTSAQTLNITSFRLRHQLKSLLDNNAQGYAPPSSTSSTTPFTLPLLNTANLYWSERSISGLPRTFCKRLLNTLCFNHLMTISRWKHLHILFSNNSID